ncbi:MAG TPA: mechanosensitive ion channel domain-containing protein [Verrucomicrobiae bacterium]|nr:mechanosensitive ion channel domain-containing protein [Verrucomicrobiae bacterium]
MTRALVDSLPPSVATNSSAGAPGPGALGETVEEKLTKTRAELAELKILDEANGARRSSSSSVQNSLRRSWLQRLARLYEQQISYASEMAALKKRTAELALEAKAWTGFGPRPYSILLADNLRESIQVERLEIANGESALSMLGRLIDEHRSSLRVSEERIRQLNEELERGAGKANAGELAWQREFERLQSQNSAASVGALDLERQIRAERLAASHLRLDLSRRQLLLAKTGVAFTEADMRNVTARLDGEEHQLERELALAEESRHAAARALEAANEDWSRLQARQETNAAVIARGEETLAVRHAQSEIADSIPNVLHFMIQLGTAERIIWEVRFGSYRNHDAGLIRETERRLNEFRRRVQIWLSYYRELLQDASRQAALQETRLAGMDDSSELASLVRERLGASRERDQLLGRAVQNIERNGRLVQRLEEDLRDATENLSFGGRLRNVLSSSGSFVSQLWGFELFVAQDTITIDGQEITGKRSVTLGKIVVAITIVVLGYWFTGLFSRRTEPFLIKHFHIEANQAGLIRRWVRVLLVFVVGFFSLIFVKIPLTAFAFAGGALAIALGFGMQTLLKNFVSGIIILFERPFGVGDILDVAGQRGTVVGIGIRSSVLELWDGTETLIPNSALLENSVTNWTYSNRKVRFSVNVGVAYGSDTRRVVQLLTEVADRHGLIEKNPQPQVLLANFGESALSFEVRFWVDVVKVNSAQVSSDLRQMIAAAFGENNIVIAFPQRDLHLDAARPLHVQILSASGQLARENGAGGTTPVRGPRPDQGSPKNEPIAARP